MSRMSEVDRGRAIARILQCQSQRLVAQQFGVDESTIAQLVGRLRATGRLADCPRSGRPRVTTQRQDQGIRLLHLRNRFQTATETASHIVGTHGRRVCPRTVRNRLREFSLRPLRPYVGPQLTPSRRQRRMQWLRAHQFRLARWRRVLFTDESRFTLYRSDGRKRCYRRRGERYFDACVKENDRFGGGSVMVFGGDFSWRENTSRDRPILESVPHSSWPSINPSAKPYVAAG
ncbi:uncharacterized protein LOC132564350 [Ylistrum balloti]|uniref:uncharacterized protein LOC132564350 n=1 Tax=Ylistrum balloti TaxID=509963 RepID=UPI002905BECA|nr:uncharacterized protein LOC132564350 [Ylistrum balloti]